MHTSSEASVADARVRLPDGVDLHARPAATFVRSAMRFSADISLTAGERVVDAKSLLSILALGPAEAPNSACMRRARTPPRRSMRSRLRSPNWPNSSAGLQLTGEVAAMSRRAD